MKSVELSPQARRDLFSILAHLMDVAGARTADTYDIAFKDVVVRLGHFSGTGTPRPDLGPETRVTSVDPYLIFYDGGPKNETVHVLRIVHGHREITPDLVARGREP